jgi:DNA-binding transcriptional regulator YdaS (Cro superfamily)
MKLAEYIKEERGNATALASELGVSLSYLSQMAGPKGVISPKRSVAIERLSGGKVMRWDCRPKDWHLTWPELIGTRGAPNIPGAKRRKFIRTPTYEGPDRRATPERGTPPGAVERRAAEKRPKKGRG